MGLTGLWTPGQRKVVDRCRIPVAIDDVTGETTACATPFYEDEPRSKIEAHMVECAGRHQDVIRAARQRQHPDIMKPQDTELFTWIRKNAAAIMDGRLKVGGGSV